MCLPELMTFNNFCFCLLFCCMDVAYCFVSDFYSSAACPILCTFSLVVLFFVPDFQCCLLYSFLLFLLFCCICHLLFCCIVVLCSSAACSVLAREVPAPPLVRDHRELCGGQAAEGVAAGVEAVSGQGGQAGQADDDEGEEEVP